MFTQKSIKWIIAFTLLTVVAFGNYGLPSVALADGPDGVVRDANEFISYLDNLREMGQVEAQIAQARYVREQAVFDYSSYLVALRDQAAALRTAANNRPTIADANGYIGHLDQLRGMGTTLQMDANGFISHLDQLRQKGIDASQVNVSQPVLP